MTFPRTAPSPRRRRLRSAAQTALIGAAGALIFASGSGLTVTAHAAGSAATVAATVTASTAAASNSSVSSVAAAPASLILSQQRDLVCLAMNIYHEGRGESARGQAAIAAVTMNRLRSPRYPNSVCQVVWQRKQFSWTLLHSRHHVIDDAQAWRRAMNIAELFLGGARLALVSEATHYHTVDVQPFWSKNIPALVMIGKHVFYAL
ncbi:MAG: cell wall hydrolase [Gammaproteobacteria bacterium]|nr:cell wall hydrolase [Gammaproteobacteria bacterium]